jgi:hypothetical protein
MKESSFRILILFLLFYPVLNCFGQNDTTEIIKKEPDFLNDKFKERISMLYIGGNTIIESMYSEFEPSSGIYAAYEHKLNKYHVVGAGMGYYLHYQDLRYYSYNSFNPLLRFDVTYKFYHNLNSRMSKGLTGNNFSANYFYVSPNFLFKLNTRVSTNYSWDFTNGYWVGTTTKERIYEPGLKLGYGFQRVIGNKMNFDMNAGFQISSKSYQWDQLPFFVQIKLGFIIK